MDLYEKHSKAKSPPSIGECCQLLQAVVHSIPKIFVVIDALDECTEATRDALLTRIQNLQPKVRLLITSRHTFGSEYELDDSLSLEVRADHIDMQHYLDERIRESRALQAHIKKDRDLHGYLVSGIVGKANGMYVSCIVSDSSDTIDCSIRFLLARLHLDSLIAKTTLRKVRSALKSLPEELDGMYDQVLERIRNQGPERAELALKVLGWIRYAARPLTLLEIQHALAIEPGDACFDEDGIPKMELVLSVCAGIVTVRENHIMGLVHYTAQEYLERRAFDYLPNAQTEIARACLTYISFDEFAQGPCLDDEIFELRLKDYPLLQYASKYWPHHGRGDPEKEIKADALEFLRQGPMLMSSIQVLHAPDLHTKNYSQKYIHAVGSLWFAASFGLSYLATALLDDGAAIEAEDSRGQRPLHRASSNGYREIVNLLLDHGAEIEAQDDLGCTPLLWAAAHGHLEIAQSLIAHEASFQACNFRGWTALHFAASNGNGRVIRLLLDQGADTDARDHYGATALYRAAENGDPASAQLLIEKGSKIDMKNEFDQSALHRAADIGHLAVARLLLEHGADFKSNDYYGWTPWYRAKDHGHEEVARVLSEYMRESVIRHDKIADHTASTSVAASAERPSNGRGDLPLEAVN